MKRAAYPLEALRTLRAEEEDAAGRALAQAIRAHEEAAGVTRRALEARDAHEAETSAMIARESARPLTEVRATDATHLRAWRDRRRGELAGLEASVAKARADEAARRGETEAAREALASARREREAIEKHHARWSEEQRRAAEAKEEAEAEDRAARRS